MRSRATLHATATWWLIMLLVVELAATAALAVTGATRNLRQRGTQDINRQLVRELELTDLALAPGTSYTRHPSQATLFAPFGDHPSAIEHFPAGSVMPPPAPSQIADPPAAKGSTP